MAAIAEHAVVLGGSLAGLAAAAALAERFERVTIVERDTLPGIGADRKGVPQGRHAHALLPAGVEGLSELFPGIVDDLAAAGAAIIDQATKFRLYLGGGRVCQPPLDRRGVSATRPLIEGLVRARVRGLANVRFVEACDALGLLTTADRATVTGVRMLRRADSSAEEACVADIVVDATGRASRTPAWLAELGYAPPAEERIHVGVRYTTRFFHRHPDDLDGCLQVLVGAEPGDRRGGFATVVEGDRWQVTLAGMLGERAPADLDGFTAYAGSLPATRDISDVVAGAAPRGDAATTTYPANTRRRYDRLTRFPERYAVIGDAVCSFNPVYGQGMSVAVQEALSLAGVLDAGGLPSVGRRFFAASRRVVDVAWSLATEADLADPQVQGPRTRRWQVTNAYMRRLLPVAHRDPVVAQTLLGVIGLVAPPERLVHPRILWRVATGARRGVGQPAPSVRQVVTAAPSGRTFDR
jgi:2-polyprenyl-6-methoxyphenol hydroxylase-like FAD-dependent oxidoreductase